MTVYFSGVDFVCAGLSALGFVLKLFQAVASRGLIALCVCVCVVVWGWLYEHSFARAESTLANAFCRLLGLCFLDTCVVYCMCFGVLLALCRVASETKATWRPPVTLGALSIMQTCARELLAVCLRRHMKLQTSLMFYKSFHKPLQRPRTRFLRTVLNSGVADLKQ